MSRQFHRIAESRQRVNIERARGDQKYRPGDAVDVLSSDGTAWVPGRVIEQATAFVVVELATRTTKVVAERLRPRE